MVVTLLLVLVVVHVVTEFYLAPQFADKKSPLALALAFQLVVTFAALAISGIPLLITALATGALMLQYGILTSLLAPLASSLKGLLFKQLVHLACITVLVLLVVGHDAREHAWLVLDNLNGQLLLWRGLAYLLALKPSSTAISLLLKNWTDELTETEDTGRNRPLKEAGTYIGYFERTLMVTFVLWGQLPGVALVLAAKSVFRFGDLKDHGSRMFTEYVMLGTFASTLAGISCGLLGVYLGNL